MIGSYKYRKEFYHPIKKLACTPEKNECMMVSCRSTSEVMSKAEISGWSRMLGCVAVCFVLLNLNIIRHVKQVTRSGSRFLEITGEAKLGQDVYLYNRDAVAAHMFSWTVHKKQDGHDATHTLKNREARGTDDILHTYRCF